MATNKGLEKIGDLIRKKSKKPPAHVWQDLALRVIKELNIPNFKKSAVFLVCKQQPRVVVEKCLNDTKELCEKGEKWKYFFKLISSEGNYKNSYQRKAQ